MTFGEKLQQLRKEKGISQEQLASQLAVSRQSVSKWELGSSLPDANKLLLIGKIFGVSIEYLLDETAENRTFNQIPTYKRNESIISFIKKLIKKKGYLVGYIISGYAALILLLLRFAHFTFKKSMLPPEGFGVTFQDLPTKMKLPLYFIDGISIIAVIVFISGIIFSIYFKKKNK